jgi:acetylornithine deacetylase/succinyl-diaminopimelate desuccinylase family protein
MVNKERLIKLTQSLIKINSENPGSSEYEIAHFIKNYLKPYNLKTEIYEFQKKRSNLLVYFGEEQKPTLVLSPHLDTVPAGKNWRYPAFSGLVHKGRLYGRGASDDKGNLAVALEAIVALKENNIKLNYQVILTATADEESGSRLGVIPLLDKKIIKPDLALVLDSSKFDIIICQKGLLHIKVYIFGKKAHGAYPYLGENAIEKAVYILKDISQYRFKFKPHKLLKPPTINIGTIQGGDRVNMVSDWCNFSLDIRFLPEMSNDLILKDIKGIIKRYTKKFKIEIIAKQDPFSIDKDNPLVVYLRKALEKNRIKFSFKGSEGATTVSFFNERKIPAVGFGIAKEGKSHATDEYVEIEDLYKGAKVLVDFLKEFQF